MLKWLRRLWERLFGVSKKKKARLEMERLATLEADRKRRHARFEKRMENVRRIVNIEEGL